MTEMRPFEVVLHIYHSCFGAQTLYHLSDSIRSKILIYVTATCTYIYIIMYVHQVL